MKQLKIFFYVIILLTLCLNFNLYGQTQPTKLNYETQRFGIFGHYSLNYHRPDFLAKELDIPSCCPKFDDGFGSGMAFGALYEMPLWENFMLGIRAGYFSKHGELKYEEEGLVYDYKNDDAVLGTFEHKIDAKLANLALEPMLQYNFWDNFNLHFGFQIGLLALTNNYKHSESLIRPSDVVYENGSRNRLLRDTSFKNLSNFSFGLLGGLSYEVFLDAKKSWIIAPEVFYQLSFTNVVSDVKWGIDNLRFGLAFKYSPIKDTKTSKLDANIKAVALNNNNTESNVLQIKVEEFESTQMKPLLTYVFFEDNSAVIPDKYTKLTPEQTKDFNIDKLHDWGVLETYYELLNIIGKRMMEYPDAKISVEGCNSNSGNEKNNKQLSTNRANAVRDYLINTWGIAQDRILLTTRDLPQEPSNIRENDGIQENRRVEITSNKMEIISPIIVHDTIRTVNPPTIKFKNTVVSDAGIKQWNILIYNNNKHINSFEGYGNPPEIIDWVFERNQNTIPKNEGDLSYQLNIIDNNQKEFKTKQTEMPIEVITINQKRREKIDDKYIDRYSLILFQFDDSKLSFFNQQVIDFIKSKLTNKSEIFISGHTDRMGNDDYNKKLSSERANVVKNSFNDNKTNVFGYGEIDKLYDNELPEGRFYCRRVDIRVETPIE